VWGPGALRGVVLLAMLSMPALAQGVDLQGVWQYTRVNTKGESYSGNINIDARGQASDVTKSRLGPVAQTGFIKSAGNSVEIIFTKAVRNGPPYNPDHFYCTIQSAQAMSCSNTDVVGSSSSTFALLRVGKPR
ncbi:MAG: hypothetical protein ACHQK9_19375, partial [Reyranellales bacterium]